MRVNSYDAPSSRWSASTLRRSMLCRKPFRSAILILCLWAGRSIAFGTEHRRGLST